MSILKVQHLSHKYSAAWAIKNISFEIERTGVIGLLGSNGAGKSTTMNIICGALKQSEGDVFINGINNRERPLKAKAQIGYLPQQPPLYLDFSVDEYLKYCAGLRLMDKAKIKAAVEEVKEKCQITHFSSRLIKNLSGGYRQRVGIAQAIIHKPALVILDEPTNGLDPNQLIEARKLIKEIGKESTVLLSSHILNEIHLMCQRIIMIEKGKLIFSDSMDAFNSYLQPTSLIANFENPPDVSSLRLIHGVKSVEPISAKRFRIFFENEAASEQIILTSIERGWRLREIFLEKGILDDVFKQLSSEASVN